VVAVVPGTDPAAYRAADLRARGGCRGAGDRSRAYRAADLRGRGGCPGVGTGPVGSGAAPAAVVPATRVLRGPAGPRPQSGTRCAAPARRPSTQRPAEPRTDWIVKKRMTAGGPSPRFGLDPYPVFVMGLVPVVGPGTGGGVLVPVVGPGTGGGVQSRRRCRCRYWWSLPVRS